MRRALVAFALLLAWAGIASAAVNVNTATFEQLEALEGVGPVKAQAIIDFRKRHGRFKTLEDLRRVEGIGEATFARLHGKVSLSGPTTPPRKP